jgi:hypothetical protein
VAAPEADIEVGRKPEPEAIVEEAIEAPKTEEIEEAEEGAPIEVEIPSPVMAGDESDLDSMFAGYAKSLGVYAGGEDEVEQDEEIGPKQEKKRKKKKKGARVVEYDPESDKTYVKRRRKRGGSEEWEEY